MNSVLGNIDLLRIILWNADMYAISFLSTCTVIRRLKECIHINAIVELHEGRALEYMEFEAYNLLFLRVHDSQYHIYNKLKSPISPYYGIDIEHLQQIDNLYTDIIKLSARSIDQLLKYIRLHNVKYMHCYLGINEDSFLNIQRLKDEGYTMVDEELHMGHNFIIDNVKKMVYRYSIIHDTSYSYFTERHTTLDKQVYEDIIKATCSTKSLFNITTTSTMIEDIADIIPITCNILEIKLARRHTTVNANVLCNRLVIWHPLIYNYSEVKIVGNIDYRFGEPTPNLVYMAYKNSIIAFDIMTHVTVLVLGGRHMPRSYCSGIISLNEAITSHNYKQIISNYVYMSNIWSVVCENNNHNPYLFKNIIYIRCLEGTNITHCDSSSNVIDVVFGNNSRSYIAIHNVICNTLDISINIDSPHDPVTCILNISCFIDSINIYCEAPVIVEYDMGNDVHPIEIYEKQRLKSFSIHQYVNNGRIVTHIKQLDW